MIVARVSGWEELSTQRGSCKRDGVLISSLSAQSRVVDDDTSKQLVKATEDEWQSERRRQVGVVGKQKTRKKRRSVRGSAAAGALYGDVLYVLSKVW